MTRTERLAQQEAAAKARLVRQRTRLAQAKSERREEEKRQRRKRHSLVGQMADDAGLLALENADLAALFAALAPLLQAPNPVAVLTSLLGDHEGLALASVDGRADLRSCATCGVSGTIGADRGISARYPENWSSFAPKDA